MLSSPIVAAALFTLASSVHGLLVPRASATSSPPPVPLVTNPVEIAMKLKAQPSSNDRLQALLADSQGNLLTGEALRQLTVFDFNNQAEASGAKGGSLLLATVDNFPILEELGIAAGVSIVEPCGLNIPHTHPRANEMLIVTEGILDTGFVQENGFNTVVETQLGTLQATVFPMGSLHFQQNPTCSEAMFVAALNNEDPGRSDMATTFWMLPSDVVDAALGFPHSIGGKNINQWRSSLPVNLAAGIDSCLQACGLTSEE
ncbi:Spherulin-1b protein [Mycena chlorophos]|uniref:Spherulin-1b protein n=1 Tax=Mycena chlorophos TaxID=658473 RepID=A0A8H6WFV7_MYCCL|nr:Spherulin-1b protein [Mycena chlorophos]